MAVKYTISRGVNPTLPGGEPLYIARVKHGDRIQIEELTEMISDQCSATTADVKGVLDNLIYILTNEVLNSRMVRMGDFGTFRASISCEMVPKEEDFNASKIRGARIRFTPGAKLRDKLKNAKFSHVTLAEPKQEEEPEIEE